MARPYFRAGRFQYKFPLIYSTPWAKTPKFNFDDRDRKMQVNNGDGIPKSRHSMKEQLAKCLIELL